MERLSRYWMITLLVLASVTVAGCEAIAGVFGFAATRIRG